MKKILTIVGARPQFIKSAMVSREFKKREPFLREFTLHTGQHFENNLSDVFFRQLELPTPYENLNVFNAGKTGEQLARMIEKIEAVCLELKPQLVLVYGDTTSTLAGALAANKLDLPVAHVEAGLRSYNKAMPEEVNRVLTDYMASLLFVPTAQAENNLRQERITEGIFQVGDVMVDLLLWAQGSVLPTIALPTDLSKYSDYALLTLHRKENTHGVAKINLLFQALASSPFPFLFPIHPRTRNLLAEHNVKVPPQVIICEPLGYFDMLKLVSGARVVWTDSGGLQKEAVVMNKKCFTLRDQTEWPETLVDGWNELVSFDQESLRHALKRSTPASPGQCYPTQEHFGDGTASRQIVDVVSTFLT